MNRAQYLMLIVLLGLMSTIEPFSVDMSLPALPVMARGLDVEGASVQISLSAFFFGMALGQLVYGPVSDRVGRRPPLLAGLMVYVVATVACVLATSIEGLIAWRFIQGLGAAAGQILSRVIVRDKFDREDAARLFSYIMFILGIAPIIAPIIGAHFVIWLGWRSIFVFLALYGIIILVLNRIFLGESIARRDAAALQLGRMTRNFGEIICNRVFLGYMLCSASAFGALFAFLSATPTIVITHLGQPPDIYGYWFAATMTGHLVALAIGARLVRRVGLDPLLRFGLGVGAFSAIAIAALAWAGYVNLFAIFVPMSVYLAGFALIVPQAIAGAMSPFPHIAGAASSLLGFLQFVAAAMTAALVGLFDDGTQRPMTTAIFVAGMIGVLAYVTLVHGRRPATN